ncbi:MAG: MFS transporter [Bacillaceae bacterium]|nr:MFS transporter [Bacillaceae bacterium]
MNKLRFSILIMVVAISGFSQGMLLPLIAIIFETDGVSSTLNGLNATALYIGILIISPFMEQPLRKFGYKPLIITGGLIVVLSLGLFPIWKSFWFWFVLRFLIGVGDNALHFGTQTWITSRSPKETRGRNISLYGLFFGVGFATGPLLTPLVEVNESLPFIISSGFCLVAWMFLFLLKNDFPEQTIELNSFRETFGRFKHGLKYAWIAFLPPLGYGFLEASFNGVFPVYGLRIGIDIANISMVLVMFSVGGILFQLPLGIISDKVGRKKTLATILLLGAISFTIASFFEHRFFLLIGFIFVSGMLVGSTFSLGISYMTDLMPNQLLPTGNILCGIAFSVGSLLGPFLSGIFIQYTTNISFFIIISMLLFSLFLCITFFHKEVKSTPDLV